jgi:hypothetical protein
MNERYSGNSIKLDKYKYKVKKRKKRKREIWNLERTTGVKWERRRREKRGK